MSYNTDWDIVIGLEVHTQLATKTKIFSGASTKYAAEANTQACAIDLALPGVLPVLNQEVVKMAVKFGLAINAGICHDSIFARKNYFYPDLPKGYQISQYEKPIVNEGSLDITLANGNIKTINITRAHLEEDAGKSIHDGFGMYSGIDLNRAGTPLLEIVSEPEISSAYEAVAYLKTIHSLVRYLDISDGNMQEGSFRCDVNISLKSKGSRELGTRAEIKNLNSFKFVEKAINYEVERQINILEAGDNVVQETRLYDANKNETRSMRSKEDAHDYRYFPDPDLLPVIFDESFVAEIQCSMPELPEAKKQRFLNEYKLPKEDMEIIINSKSLANYFEITAITCKNHKLAANWILGDLTALLNRKDLTVNQSPISAEVLAGLICRIVDRTISGKIAKSVFDDMAELGQTADEIINRKGLKQITDNNAIEDLIDTIIESNPKQVQDFKNGKDKLFGFFVGQAMKATKGKANPQQVNEILKEKLASS